MNDLWPQRYPGSIEYLTRCINYNVTIGMYRKEDDELIGWVAVLETGSVGNLCIKDEYMRKGYALNMVKIHGLKQLEAGGLIIGHIVHENPKTLKLLEKIKFSDVVDHCSFIGVEKGEEKKEFPLWGI